MQQEKLILKKRKESKFIATQIGVILCLILSLPNSYASKVVQNEKNYYHFIDGLDELSFDITSTSLNDLLTTKFALDKTNTVVASVKWEDDEELKIEISNIDKFPKRIREHIKNIFHKRAQIVIDGNFQRWVKGYSLHKIEKSVKKYQDPSGLLDKSEIAFHETALRLSIIEKKPIGTTRTRLFFKRQPWSKGLKVLDKISRSVYEGSRAIRSETLVAYKKQGDFWMPKTVTTETTQGVSMNSKDSVERKISETFEFSNFEIED